MRKFTHDIVLTLDREEVEPYCEAVAAGLAAIDEQITTLYPLCVWIEYSGVGVEDIPGPILKFRRTYQKLVAQRHILCSIFTALNDE